MRLEIFDCCNPWDDIQIRPTEEVIIGVFLKEELDPISFEIEDNGRDVICGQCCKCPTGRFVVAEVKPRQVKKARKLGFK